MILSQLRVPIVQAPMAGGPSTPELAAAVSQAGGLGFVAAGYRTVDDVAADLRAVAEATSAPFGVNVFAPPTAGAPAEWVDAYAASLAVEAQRHGVAVGRPRSDDDDYSAKLKLLASVGVAVVSFTFGCPSPAVVAELRARGTEVWVTVTAPEEAEQAQSVGADALVVQGMEAGGHRGYFVDGPENEDFGLLVLLQLIAPRTRLPLIATGGIMDGAGIAAVLCAGAHAAQLGTAFMLTPEAGTSPAHRAVLAARAPTRLTRAFSGRQARGIVNRFMDAHDAQAPAAYPQVHHLTAPIRAAARSANDADAINLWAGQGHELARDVSAGELVHRLAGQARGAVLASAERLGS